MDDKSFHVRIPKRWVRVAMIVGVTALIVAPLTAIASHSFTDVPDSNIFHSDIEWLADAGVTKGCNPPANTEFCPKDNVTSEAMSAFMHRFASYIDAEDGTPAQADNAATADDADTLDGLDGSAYQSVVSAAIDGDNGFNLYATATDVAEVTIQAPTDGVLVIQGNATIWNNTGSPSAFGLQGVLNGSLIGLPEFAWMDASATTAGPSNEIITLLTAAEVSAGSHTVAMKAGAGDSSLGAGSFYINRGNLVVTFHPGSVNDALLAGGQAGTATP